MKVLEENLQGLSDEESKNALLYYNEYLNDAADSDKDLDEVLKQLGSPEDLADMLKAEESFNKAQKKPGLRNFNRAMKNAFLGVSNPVGVLGRGLFLVFVYSFLIVFLGGALVFLLGAITGFSTLLYEMFMIPSEFLKEKLGTLGMALFVLSLLFIISLGFLRISQWLIRLASKTVRNMLRKKAGSDAYEANEKETGKSKDRLIVGFSLGIIGIGLILAFSSGLPVKLFNIFNSTKPDNINIVVSEYNAADVSSINISTAHSCISIINDDTKDGKIVITYEQADWTTGKSAIEDGKVTFRETSNGRLPLFELVSLHESRTYVTLYLPSEFSAEEIHLESKGGFVSIMDAAQNISAQTDTGMITLYVSENSQPYSLKAKTETGILDVDRVYPEAKDYREITINQQNSARFFELNSNRGNITVK
jgi:uncharacterized membrane protein